MLECLELEQRQSVSIVSASNDHDFIQLHKKLMLAYIVDID
jgi:hypothetical protein